MVHISHNRDKTDTILHLYLSFSRLFFREITPGHFLRHAPPVYGPGPWCVVDHNRLGGHCLAH